jgi:hypothetical protein
MESIQILNILGASLLYSFEENGTSVKRICQA